MQDQNNGMDPKGVEQYRPITRGGTKALALLAALPISAAVAYVVVRIWCGTDAPTGTRVLGAIIAVLAPLAILLSVRTNCLGNQHLLAWCREYRRRNILGYTGMFWFQDGTLRFRPYENEKGWDGWMPRADRQRDIGPCPKCPPGHEAHRERYGQYYAMLPLGGWHSSYKYPHNQDGGVYEVGRIGSLGAGWRVGFVGLAPDGNDLLVTVTDPTGSSTSCSLRRAFTILQIADQLTPKVGLAGIFGAIISSAFGGGRKSVTLGDVFAAMDDELRGAMRDNDAAREEIATARADLSRRDRHKGRRQSAGART